MSSILINNSASNDDKYIGQKGYTIHKQGLTIEQEEKILKDLTIQPIVSMGIPKKYAVFRQSLKKYYLPKYYGITNFGIPSSIKINDGINISLDFNGNLMEMQKQAVSCYMNNLHPIIGGGGLLEIYCGGGKTCTALYICHKIAKKTLIIVHKEFLANQWIERIKQFLPNARVGRIQAKIIDIVDKDIVICMLQSLSMKEYPDDLFADFGLLIVDEVHHISSEVFSNALTKVITKYTLGLSATMERLDGTSHVFRMFLGNVVFKAVRKDDNPIVVLVRAINYSHPDEEYNKVITNYKGEVQFSSMISKLCAFEPRCDFIINIVIDLFNENPNQQILLLAHYRNILEYFYNKFNELEQSVGYYVGGMKEKALKESENKKIILATYMMAAEALDIKTLSTLIMATPKVNIEQSIGRILRVKHNNPIVIDIIDIHRTFKNQWYKRKKFYNAEKYVITEIKSTNYSPTIWNEKSNSISKCCNSTIQTDTDTDEEAEEKELTNKLLINILHTKLK